MAAAHDNIATTTSLEPWMFRPSTTAFTDLWFSDSITRESDDLMIALQRSVTHGGGGGSEAASASATASSVTEIVKPGTPRGQSSGSDPETVSKKSNRVLARVPITTTTTRKKRKSRASKKSTTTFIAADPENFRQMVQQVTGVQLGVRSGSCTVAAPILKPQPQRLVGGRVEGCLPTLDTSAFLLDHHHHLHHEQQVVCGGGGGGAVAAVDFAPPVLAVESGGGDGAGFEFGTFDGADGFTIESWKLM
ncbi:hypothetical protein Dimus_002066 [Dionaea muscipula]